MKHKVIGGMIDDGAPEVDMRPKEILNIDRRLRVIKAPGPHGNQYFIEVFHTNSLGETSWVIQYHLALGSAVMGEFFHILEAFDKLSDGRA